MKKKLQVFISSTYVDLIEERQKAVEAVLEAGHIPAGMELFKAGKTQMETIKKWIDESDVYCLILGGRYGSIEEASQLSYTQLEYEYAVSKDKPLFAIVLDESMLYHKMSEDPQGEYIEKGNSRYKYEKFKEEVGKRIYLAAHNTSDIATHMHAQLNSISNDPDLDLPGWRKGTGSVRWNDSELSGEQRKQLDEADERIRKFPQDPYAYKARADLLVSIDIQYLQKAIPDYLYAIFLNPEFSKAYYDMIRSLVQGGDYARALRYSEEACRLFPNEGGAYGCRGYVQCEKGLYRESIIDCDKAINLRPNRWYYNTRGRCYQGLNQLYEALEDFITAHRLDSEYMPAVRRIRSVVRKLGISEVIGTAVEEKKKGNFEKAKKYLECAMLTDPKNEDGLRECGGWYYDMRQFSKALEYWEKTLEIHKSCQNYYLCAVACKYLGKTQRAKELACLGLSYPDDGFYGLTKELLRKTELEDSPDEISR